MDPSVKEELIARKRLKEISRTLLPDALPRKRARKQSSPERTECHLVPGTPTVPPSPKLHSWQMRMQSPIQIQDQMQGIQDRLTPVSQRRVQLLSQKIDSNDETVKDKRGGKRQRREYQWKNKIIEYISSIPAQESHYSRNDAPNRKYLPTELSVVKLYKGFLAKHRDGSTLPPVSRQWFNEVFLTEFNLSFKPPRVDTCPTCDSFKVEIDSAPTEELKTLAKQKLDIHHKQTDMARDKMNKDGIKSRSHDSDIRVVQFDLQQQMYLPTLTHTQMYYSRQLACVNMGIHLEDEGKGIMFLWNETVGQRGSNEIASCLYKFFTDSEIGHTTNSNELDESLARWLEVQSDEEEDVDLDVHTEFDDKLAPAHIMDECDAETRAFVSAEDKSSDQLLAELLPKDHLTFDWSHDRQTFTGTRETFTGQTGPTFTLTAETKPVDVFLKFFDDELLDLITRQICLSTD
ncbi:hypothetical protein PYW08_006263 [Mythimna loreyi]|uniref:Uncharacterized protein n=1 Tax=Mythimna loreyi TaxID=667449 RepID=A0ACC2QSA2_9NEOP|nr:hypothetical protein PYW08_006263 [Mythimna loreyi]